MYRVIFEGRAPISSERYSSVEAVLELLLLPPLMPLGPSACSSRNLMRRNVSFRSV